MSWSGGPDCSISLGSKFRLGLQACVYVFSLIFCNVTLFKSCFKQLNVGLKLVLSPTVLSRPLMVPDVMLSGLQVAVCLTHWYTPQAQQCSVVFSLPHDLMHQACP